MSKEGLFRSLVSPVTHPNGVLVSYPGKPYHNGPETTIMPHKEGDELLVLDMVFMVYTEKFRPKPLLEFVKELTAVEKRREQHEEVKPKFYVDKTPVVPEALVSKIEEPEDGITDLDDLPDRTQEDANAELQQIAYEIDPVRKSVGFSTLKNKSTTIKDIYKFITEKRNLHTTLSTNSNSMPVKNEWISIALHGFTDVADKEKFQYNTRKWAKKWYTKKILEQLFKDKGADYDPKKKVGELFDEAWDAGWLKRDPTDIMDGIDI